MNYNERTKEICIQAAYKNEHCALLEIIKLYKKGNKGFEKDESEADKWQSTLDNLLGRAKCPQCGFDGKLKKCDD